MTGTPAALDWLLRWLQTNVDPSLRSTSALRGDVDSLRLAELLTAAEYELALDGWSDLAPDSLDTVAGLAAHLAASPPAGGKRWFRPLAEVETDGEPGDSRQPGYFSTRTAQGEPLVGIERDSSARTGRLGSVLLVGERAGAAATLVTELTAAVAGFDPIPVWYPMLTTAETGRDHPQNVGAAFESGRLPHAACLEFLQQLAGRPDGLYCGIGFGYRREPARRWDAAGRLEAYRVWEAVWCGPAVDAPGVTARLQDAVGAVLARVTGGDWVAATDGFTPGVKRKNEWTVAGGGPGAGAALSSVNDHGTTFVQDGRTSLCVGVGIDRIADLGLL